MNQDRASHVRRHPRLVHILAVASVTLLVGLTIACAPPASQPPPPPEDIALMDDAQLDAALAGLRARAEAGLADPAVRNRIPREHLGTVEQMVKDLGSPEGRAKLGEELRAAAKDKPRGLPARSDSIDTGELAMSAGFEPATNLQTPPRGSRDRPPPTDEAVSVPVGATSGPCSAPDGVGTVPAPAGGARGGALLTPQHDVFTRSNPGMAIGVPGPISITGQDPVAGQGPGIELRTTVLDRQQMRVRVHLEDPKRFGPAALWPLISIRPIGGSPTDEYRPAIAGARIHCYAGDTSTSRGYFEAWVNIPRSTPGFQVIVEVVDNDWWFANNTGFPPDLLASAGAQYWAGADRATIHIGADAVTSTATIERSVGAFASSTADPGNGTPNVLTDTNGQMSDDVEAAVQRVVNRIVRDKVNSALAGDIVQAYVFTLQANLTAPIRASTQLRFADPSELGGSISGETEGAYRALRADVSAGVDVRLFVQLLGIPCTAITANIETDLTAYTWADSAGDGTGLGLRLFNSVDTEADFDMPTWAWLDPTCVLAWTLGPPAADIFIDSAVRKGVAKALAVDQDACPPTQEPPEDGQYYEPHPGRTPAICQYGDGAIQKMLAGFDLAAYMPGVANLKPLVTDIDNAWCRATGAPAGCTPDQSLIGAGGVEMTADAALFGTLADTLGFPLQGRFRNVYAPKLYSSVEDVVVTHRDLNGAVAGLGLVVDPRQINLALRHLSQGGGTSRTTDGLIDVGPIALPGGASVAARPEVAPILLGLPEPEILVDPGDGGPPPGGPPAAPAVRSRRLAPVVLPDMRLDLVTAPGTDPISFSLSASTNVGVGFDAATGNLRPEVGDPTIDLQVVGGCQADYVNAYALSYALCGRGTAGAGGNVSLTDLVDFVVNQLVLPPLTASIGGLKLPDLAGILPGFDAALTNVRSAQRGGHLAVYADLRPVPMVGIAISPNQSSEPPALRFFPSGMYNIDTSRPTTYTWEVRDGTTDAVLATSVIAGTGNSAVRAPLESFTLGHDSLGDYRLAKAQLTVTQTNLNVSATATYKWRPPSPPPPTPCQGTVVFLAPTTTLPTVPC